MLEGGICAAAPAKINRFLHILGRRDDGYHLLETGFQFIQWCDWIHFRVSEIPGIRILNDPMHLGKENLVYKAATRIIDPNVHGIDIMIEKYLPVGGGLGGGSSDAATTLVSSMHCSGWDTQPIGSKILDSQLVRMSLSLFSERAASPQGLVRNLKPAFGRVRAF